MTPNNKKIAIILIGAAIIAVVIFGMMKFTNKSPETVSTEVIQKRTLEQTIALNGKIEARDSFEAVLGTSQKVVDVYKKTGDLIQAGDILLKLDTSDLEYQLQKAQVSLESLKKSTSVSKNQALINLDNAKIQYNQALNTYNDTKTLFDNGIATSDELSASEAALNTAENQIKSLEIQINSLDIASSTSDKKAQADAYILDIANYKRKIAESSIVSTVNGTLTVMDARPGQFPTQTYNKVQVVDLSSLLVKINVNQEEAILLKAGQQCTLKIKGMKDEYKGTVFSISNVASISNNSSEPKFQVEITIENPKQDLRVGYEADIFVKLNEKTSTLCVNYDAVKIEEDGRSYVFIINNGKAVKKYIMTGIETEDYIEVLEGLKEGETYITLYPDTMKEGDMVKSN